MKPKENMAIVCLIGLGYVGLPLAEAFAKEFKVIDLILIPRKFIFTLTITKH